MIHPRVTIFTQIPSPYQVELFDALLADARIVLRVVYVQPNDAYRSWRPPCLENHEHVFLSDGKGAEIAATEWSREADLVVFSWYGDRTVRKLIEQRQTSKRAWCYWGECPGFSRWKSLGRLRRRILLKPLARSHAPIWGIGSWAVCGWRAEFGDKRQYFNIPYFSDLSRFLRKVAKPRTTGTRTILFSGALSRRKGIDLLAQAFARVSRDFPHLRLDILGSGELTDEIRATLRECAGRVRLLGFQQWSDLPSFYHTADVLCAPSRYDGWGLIVPEGLAAGLPVIATDKMGAAVDLLQDQVNGLKLAAGSSGDLEHALRRVADLTDDELATMSGSATATAERHSLQNGVERICEAVNGTIRAFQ